MEMMEVMEMWRDLFMATVGALAIESPLSFFLFYFNLSINPCPSLLI